MLNTGCSSKDQYGSNDCTLNWGSNYTATIVGALTKPLNAGSKFSADLKLDSVVPLKIDCPICGANCTFDVPIVKKSVSFTLPPCPIAATSINKVLSISLPAKDPVPVKIGVEGTVTAMDETGATVASISVTGSVSTA